MHQTSKKLDWHMFWVVHSSVRYAFFKQDISKTIFARALKLGEHAGDDE